MEGSQVAHLPGAGLLLPLEGAFILACLNDGPAEFLPFVFLPGDAPAPKLADALPQGTLGAILCQQALNQGPGLFRLPRSTISREISPDQKIILVHLLFLVFGKEQELQKVPDSQGIYATFIAAVEEHIGHAQQQAAADIAPPAPVVSIQGIAAEPHLLALPGIVQVLFFISQLGDVVPEVAQANPLIVFSAIPDKKLILAQQSGHGLPQADTGVGCPCTAAGCGSHAGQARACLLSGCAQDAAVAKLPCQRESLGLPGPGFPYKGGN